MRSSTEFDANDYVRHDFAIRFGRDPADISGRTFPSGLVMRLVGTLLVIVFTTLPAFAQQAAPAASKPTAAAASKAAPKPGQPAGPSFSVVRAKGKPAAAAKSAATSPARGAYAAMSEAERMAIQSDLIWTGDYNGVIGADFGERAVAAVKAFQKRHRVKETGILSSDERTKLAEEAKPKQEDVGWQLVDDRATGAWLGLPGKLVPKASAGKAGSHWQSARGEVQVDTFRVSGENTTLPAVFEQQKKDNARRVEYQVLKSDFFVISGLQGLKKFYVRAQVKDTEVRGIAVLYDQAMEGIMDPVAVAMSSAFVPFPNGKFVAPLPPGPPPKRKVEYGTGIVVSRVGHIITDRQVIDGCQVVVAAGFGPADRIAEDKTADLALLRVYGARDLVPAPFAGEVGRDADVTLLGIAEPQVQNGGNAVSIVPAHLLAASGSSRPIEPTPALGFSGAAVVGSDARLLGMVTLKAPVVAGPPSGASRATIVPADAMRAFLYAQSVAPHSGSGSLDTAKASVVRVICVRK